jgi:hypothetical protein
MAAGPAHVKRPSLRDGAFFLGTRLCMYVRLVRDKVLRGAVSGLCSLEDRVSGALACTRGLLGTRF